MGIELLKSLIKETSMRIGNPATLAILNNAYKNLPESERADALKTIQELMASLK